MMGSGKSYWTKNFIKCNRKKGQEIFVFSPFKQDDSFEWALRNSINTLLITSSAYSIYKTQVAY